MKYLESIYNKLSEKAHLILAWALAIVVFAVVFIPVFGGICLAFAKLFMWFYFCVHP